MDSDFSKKNLKGFTLLEITRLRKKNKENKSLTPLEVFRSGRNHKKNTPLTGLTGFTPLEITRLRKKNKENKSLTGFTLIELLVVVAIIALLTSIIVVGIIRARIDAQDEAVVANLITLRSEAEPYWIETGAYIDFCGLNCHTGSKVWQQICQEVHLQSGAVPFCHALANSFCAQSVLRGGGSYCVDSAGYAGTMNLFCDSLNATCVSD